MDILLSNAQPSALKTDLLVLACADDTPAQDELVLALDALLGGSLRQAISDERFQGKPSQVLWMHTQGRLPALRVAIIGVGARAQIRTARLQEFAGRAARLASSLGASKLALVPPAAALAGSGPGPAATAGALALGVLLGGYKFDKYLADEKRTSGRGLAELLFGQAETGSSEVRLAVARAERIAAAVARARDLVNEPAGVMTPTAMATAAREIAERNRLEVSILGPAECAQRGMGLFLAVAQGSAEEPRFIHLAWRPPGAKARVVLVGKGVTFDSGGLSLKSTDNMLDMKTDMAGAATVLSVMEPVAREALPVEVHALAACTENMPSGRAYKLGDVLRSKAGKTVEINNTDAEGRLTLADAITYGLELEPTALLDFATLTGACVVALGPTVAGVMSNDESLLSEFLAAARDAGEDMWPLPLPERLAEQLKSEVADMKNTGERWGGAITAALFLKEFVGQVPWAHVDIAGPSSADKEWGATPKGGTGFGVATIFEYLRKLSAT